MPGPMLLATIRWSAARGRLVGPLVVAGHAVVEVPLMAALVLGLGEQLSRDLFVGTVGLAGGLALAALGAAMLRSARGLKLPDRSSPPMQGSREGLLRIVGSGAITSVSNPYFTLWWATVGLNFLVQARPFGPAGYATFYAGHVLADMVWYGAVSESLHHGRRLLSDATYRLLIRCCAGLLAAFGAFFVWRGWHALAGAI
jgi:threonine/homoserine/homoserine lactone efflux protein